MEKSILILGQHATGKTTKFKELLSVNTTAFCLDGAVTVNEIKSVYSKAKKVNSFCVITSQLPIEKIPISVLSKFEIMNLNAVK